MKHRTARGISFLTTSAAVLLFGTFACAQGQRQPPPRRPEAAPQQIIVVTSPTEPSTKLEALSAQPGVVVVQRSTTIGELSGKGGSVTIEVKEFIDTSNPNQKVTGLGLLVKNQAEALSHTSLARINFSDLPQLKGLMQDAKAEIDAAPQSGNQ